ncbi:hypothetical protein MJ923_16985 [Shewanella sp. 3B26]|uniref:Uncharacterized protein n=1 Tax=Shewanella zhuhaiensis TaxID=2919576 RepID=A0AAJ1BJL5_9GAMM|nr:hypothetical protein [Shewanella zhuhaiensis]MCH4296005.1 hypothetical protein [Shewanella zhuhaiensis]
MKLYVGFIDFYGFMYYANSFFIYFIALTALPGKSLLDAVCGLISGIAAIDMGLGLQIAFRRDTWAHREAAVTCA